MGIRIAAISYDPVPTNRKFAKQSNITFPILSDAEYWHVKAFGILNESYAEGHRAYGIPHPGIFLVGKDGKVVAKLAEADYKERPPLETVLEAARAMTGRVE